MSKWKTLSKSTDNGCAGSTPSGERDWAAVGEFRLRNLARRGGQIECLLGPACPGHLADLAQLVSHTLGQVSQRDTALHFGVLAALG